MAEWLSSSRNGNMEGRMGFHSQDSQVGEEDNIRVNIQKQHG